MNINDIATQLLYTTAPILIELPDGKTKRTGTGFFYNADHPTDARLKLPLLITNRHVIDGGRRGVIQMFKLDSSGMPKPKDKLTIEFDHQFLSSAFLDATLDIAAFPIGGLMNLATEKGTPLFFRAVDQSLIPPVSAVEELSAIEEIVFIGYPSGIIDTISGFPIIRKGITATPIWSDFAGAQNYLIDAGVFPGSSGSPVFIYNQGSYVSGQNLAIGSRVYFVGVITETMLRSDESGKAFLGLGKVINPKAFQLFITGMQSRIKRLVILRDLKFHVAASDRKSYTMGPT